MLGKFFFTLFFIKKLLEVSGNKKKILLFGKWKKSQILNALVILKNIFGYLTLINVIFYNIIKELHLNFVNKHPLPKIYFYTNWFSKITKGI